MEKDVNRLRLAKEALESGSYDRETIEYIFPELKESEDEKIRKELLNAFQKSEDSLYMVLTPHRRESFIAWLEKQEGCEYIKKDWLEHIKQSWYKEGFIDGKYSGGTSKEWTINDAATLKELIDFLENRTAKLQHDLTRYANWLKIQFTPIEKQDEQKSFDFEHANIPQRDFVPKSALEAANEEKIDNQNCVKPTDKVEPKFKIGDWVVYDHRAYKVVTLPREGCINLGLKRNGKLEFAPFTYCRPWTIADAKDGDVLYSPCLSLLWIFKSIDTVYCGCNLNYNDGAFCGEGYIERPTDAILATKEQRDTLEKAMADAGWKFDFEKKELKKIEQKTAWSEGDDYNLQCMIAKVTSDIQKGNVGRNNELIEWLKSLKDRYTWKPSEEQIEILDMVLSNESMDDNVANILRKLREQLKKLREE